MIPEFAKALGKLPSGIFVVVAQNGNEKAYMVASWVQQTSFDPPRVSVAVGKDREINEWMQQDQMFSLHVIGENQKELYQRFIRPGEVPPLENSKTHNSKLGTLILEEPMAFMECKVFSRCEAGDHTLIISDVVDGSLQLEEKPMVHIRKNGLSY